MLNPATLSLRLKDFNYKTRGGYFITVRFNSSEELNDHLIDCISNSFASLSERYPEFILDEWIVMSDHLHFIFLLIELELGKTSLSVGNAVRAIKARVTHDMQLKGHVEFSWQSNYFDRIIRNEVELNKFRHYIHNNPLVRELETVEAAHAF